MDVTLVLTHRCNLSCHYCYAGEHLRKEMDEVVLGRALDLLFADRSEVAQLSFFGGEPFLAFDAMRHAVEQATARAEREGRRLLLQCTTNGTLLGPAQVAFVVQSGMRVTVSIDGVQEAHDQNRPRAGGGSSFAQVYGGLRTLIDAGARPDAMMVVTPATAPFVFRSVDWLWREGVTTVRANLSLSAPWTLVDRAELRSELTAVGREMLRRRLRGETALFQPFEAGLRTGGGVREAERAAVATSPVRCGAPRSPVRGQVVVGTTGNLYPCSPMVGEDRDRGPEAAMRIGHVRDDVASIVGRVVGEGAGCGDGRACACAAYLETGNRNTGGANGLWFGRLCAELGAAVAAALARGRAEAARAAVAPPAAAAEDDGVGRRTVLKRALVGVGGLALVGGAAATGLSLFRTSGELVPDNRPAGAMMAPPSGPPRVPAAPPRPPRTAQPPPAPPPPDESTHVEGLVAMPPVPPKKAPAPPETAAPGLKTPGDLGPPPPPDTPPPAPEIMTRGEVAPAGDPAK